MRLTWFDVFAFLLLITFPAAAALSAGGHYLATVFAGVLAVLMTLSLIFKK